MKTLVTHLIPHLDDVAGFWLLKRFDPALKRSKFKFVATAANGIKLKKNEVGVGVGRGKYDEHKGDKKDSATSLIWKDLKKRGKLPKGDRGKAIAELVDFVRRGDLGEFIGMRSEQFGLSAILRAVSGLKGHDSKSETEIGLVLLDALVDLYESRIRIDRAIDRGIKVRTKHAKGIAITVDAIPGAISGRIAERGYDFVIVRYDDSNDLHIRVTPGTPLNLTKLAKAVMREEPETGWYLHHSKKMLLGGDRIAVSGKPTRFTPKRMARLITEIYRT